jgi:hypothetical protein
MAKIGTLADFADDALLKSGWNWALIHNDGSRGVHNPFFANGALIAARDALVELSGSGSRTRALDRTRPGMVGSRQERPFETLRGVRK